MWTCPQCGFEFRHQNQVHSCGEKAIEDFLAGKPAHTIALYHHFTSEYLKLGPIALRPTKSMIGFTAGIRFCSIIKLGKDHIDVVFHLDKLYPDNLCFHRMAQVPGSNTFNHHCRIYSTEDLNAELRSFMKLAFELGK